MCLDPSQSRLETQTTVLAGERLKQREAMASFEVQQKLRRRARATISPVFPTCIDASSAKYLNMPAVWEAMHVRKSTVPNGKWSDCGNVNYTFNYESELPKYEEWAKAGDLQILIYNGDADFILSHMGNAAWINDGLKLAKMQDWTKWRGSDGQVAGYFERYTTAGGLGIPLSFLTVKGAGHMVPRDRPKHALDMFERFLAGGDYDRVQPAPTSPLCS